MADVTSCVNSLYPVSSSDSQSLFEHLLFYRSSSSIWKGILFHMMNTMSVSQGMTERRVILVTWPMAKQRYTLQNFHWFSQNCYEPPPIRSLPPPPRKNAHHWKWLSIPFSFTLTPQTSFVLKLCKSRAQKILKVIWRDFI